MFSKTIKRRSRKAPTVNVNDKDFIPLAPASKAIRKSRGLAAAINKGKVAPALARKNGPGFVSAKSCSAVDRSLYCWCASVGRSFCRERREGKSLLSPPVRTSTCSCSKTN
eukprot:TRINITY_DN6070_c0_g1_i10.p1 TRINITY_DN6070_c0_g1~~TRINITY_DN6070_c0_g1_i10.p1  ORF type:complete len:111 (-),score=10.42 TRINITY_DN6070_c0_g1_i10:347-679(-)